MLYRNMYTVLGASVIGAILSFGSFIGGDVNDEEKNED